VPAQGEKKREKANVWGEGEEKELNAGRGGSLIKVSKKRGSCRGIGEERGHSKVVYWPEGGKRGEGKKTYFLLAEKRPENTSPSSSQRKDRFSPIHLA